MRAPPSRPGPPGPLPAAAFRALVPLLALVPGPWCVAAVLVHRAAPTEDMASVLEGCDGIECVDRFVAMPDSSYSWYDTKERISGTNMDNGVNWTGYILNMTSQTWKTEAQVDFPQLWHVLVIIVPSNLEVPDWSTMTLDFGMNLPSGVMIRMDNRAANDTIQQFVQPGTDINHGSLHEKLPEVKLAAQKAAYYATTTRSLGTSLLCLQNGYETFANDWSHRHRNGEYLKAYGYTDFVRNGAMNPERVGELPMAKAVVRAMDTVTSFTAGLPSGRVRRFGLAAYSKLGTVAWLAGALDDRVKVLVTAAIHMDLYNMIGSLAPKDDKQPHLQLYDYFMNLTSVSAKVARVTAKLAPRAPPAKVTEFLSSSLVVSKLAKLHADKRAPARQGNPLGLINPVGLMNFLRPFVPLQPLNLFGHLVPMPPYPYQPIDRLGFMNPFRNPLSLMNPVTSLIDWWTSSGDYKSYLLAMEYKDLFAAMGTPVFERVHRLLDPSAFPERLKMPVYFIMGSKDSLFSSCIDEIADPLPTLRGHTSFYEVPNCMHEETLVRSIQSSAAFVRSVILNVTSIPEIKASFDKERYSISFRQVSPHVPINITQWTGHSTPSRDFQYSEWKPMPITLDSDNAGAAAVIAPRDGTFSGSFVEFVYQWPTPEHVFKVSTPVYVAPQFWVPSEDGG